ncbi:MAG: MarR family winged helix-turn-helix transcriptional regulator [Bradyrhizobium sp.]
MSPRRATKSGASRSAGTQNEARTPSIKHHDETVRRFIWSVFSIRTHLDDIHQIWANLLGVSEPQWLILLAIDELDSGEGVPGTKIAAKLHIHPVFVTTQTKSLEKAGFVTRITSAVDARFVLMSLTSKARTEIAKLSAQRRALNESLFAGLDDQGLQDVTNKLTEIMKNAEKAARRLSAED